MITPYIDLHTHTTHSDGRLSPQELVAKARNAGIKVLAITDHNHTEDLAELRKAYPDMTFIQGAEISCLYSDSTGEEHELHVVALGFDPENPKIKQILKNNCPDRRPYINRMLEKLRACGIDIGTYEDIRQRFPETTYIGRMVLARCMVEDGYTSSVDQGFDLYLGAHGERRAYVKNPLKYVSLETAVSGILDAGGVPVLAHLLYYKMSEAENERLVGHFRELTGSRGAMEVFYSRYNTEKRLYCQQLCQKNGLMASAASDYHAQENWEKLEENRFSYSVCTELLGCLGVEVPDAVPAFDLFVLSGYSGSGKGTICEHLQGEAVGSKPIRMIRSVTTRKPRAAKAAKNENICVEDNYRYIDEETFGDLVKKHQLFEYNAAYGKNSYGTPIDELRKAVDAAAAPCLEIDRIGLKRILTDGKINPNRVHSVFIAAPAAEIVKRLLRRGTEDENSIRIRLETAISESEDLSIYDTVVVNHIAREAAASVLRAFEGTPDKSRFDAAKFQKEMEEILTSYWKRPDGENHDPMEDTD